MPDQEDKSEESSKSSDPSPSTAASTPPVPPVKASLIKQPGWRQPSSMIKVSEDRRKQSENSDGEVLMETVKSDTSISSHGPLKELIRGNKTSNPAHHSKVQFKPSKELVEQAMQQSESLAMMKVREPSLESIGPDRVKTTTSRQDKGASNVGSTGPSACPVNSMGGYKFNTLDHVTMVHVDYSDDDDDVSQVVEQPVEKSSKTNRVVTGKSGKSAGKSTQKHPKTVPFVSKEEPKSQRPK